MGRAIVSGALAGVAGAVACGLTLAIMAQPTVEGLITPMLLLSQALHTSSALAVWLVVLAAGAILGGLFGVVAGQPQADAGRIAPIGFFGMVGLWVVLSVAVMPYLLGVTPIAMVRSHDTWPWIVGMMVAALAYAGIVTVTFTALHTRRRVPAATERERDVRRAA